ncbi:unnamed protein product [Urochloa decumbens]|uniref:Disease resistance protein At4g27190-like leucine-rich repeats domain-containing protein n=1 Tax=Urochloa decumbens TaxID=240449 RepID=A0ABC9BUG0_9POAL
MAVQKMVPYLKDLTVYGSKPKDIYFDGWHGLGTSTVLRAIAENPPPSLFKRFDKIIHIDCSSWKSQRELQRAIADELNLTQQVAADFDRQDEEDDFSGVDQGSRTEIGTVARVIFLSLVQYPCLVILHNGSDVKVDLFRCGIPQLELIGTKVLWTFTGWFRFNPKILSVNPKLSSDLFLCATNLATNWDALLAEEAREIVLYARKLGLGVTPEIATACFLYYLSLGRQGDDIIYFNWAMHASNYWICDGIVGGGQQDNQAWELAHALQQHMRLEEYSSSTLLRYCYGLRISTKHWVSLTNSYFDEVPSGTTSLFFAPVREGGYVSVPRERFHEVDQLRVLKLCRCTFNFSSPPFHCCRNLRFLGLDKCMDEQQLGEEKTGARALETFQRLWVLDVSNTNWELNFSLETEEPVATNIEVHINKGRIWRGNLAWRRMPNLFKLRVIEPTRYWWEAGREDEVMDMVKLELLVLSKNSTIQVFPNLSDATNLKTLVLDGCVGLEHVGPHGLPPSLESFRFDSGSGEDDENRAKISCISLAGCAKLTDFRLHGSLPNLEELDLSCTAVKMLDLKDEAAVKSLQKFFLVGCEQLRSISWSYRKKHPIRLLCIDTCTGGEVARKPSSSCDSSMVCKGKGGKEYCHAFVAVTDMRFLQSIEFLWWWWDWRTPKVKANLCWSSTSKGDGKNCHKKKMHGHIPAGSLLPRSLTYYDIDISTEHQITSHIDGSSNATTLFQPVGTHMEIGEGVNDVPNTVSKRGSGAICYVMDRVKSLHVHDNCSITAVTPENIFASPSNVWGVMNKVRWCRVERCPRLQTVFNTQYEGGNFSRLEIFWAAHLLMARYIWYTNTRMSALEKAWGSFRALRAIHLHFCPRLTYVLRLTWDDNLSQLETLHILSCGDLRQVFLVEGRIQEEIAAPNEKSWMDWKSWKGMLGFTKLKDLYLHELPNLQLICETKMFAPNLETIYIRGCWSLRRLPATDTRRYQDGRPVAVDCEKDWWDKLEWDGMESGHHPSLFKPRHSKYYRK